MQDVLHAPGIREKVLTEPLVAEWTADRLKAKRRRGEPDAEALAERIFDDTTVRHLIEAGNETALLSVLDSLPPKCLEPATDLLAARWPVWEGLVAGAAAMALALAAPGQAARLFQAHIDSPALYDDLNKTLGVLKALEALPAPDADQLSGEMLERLREHPVGAADVTNFRMVLELAWKHRLPVMEQLLRETFTSVYLERAPEGILAAAHELLTEGSPFFQHIEDLQEEHTSQSFVSLAPLFDADAPLAELDGLVARLDKLDVAEAAAFLEERCGSRTHPAKDCVQTALKDTAHAVPPEYAPLVARFALAVGAASWLAVSPDYADAAFEECVHVVSFDLPVIPGYTALQTRMSACPPEEAVRLISARFSEVETHLGAAHLAELMGDLGHEAFAPVLIDCLKKERPDSLAETAMEALTQFGGCAETTLLERWNELDDMQQAYSLDVLSEVGGDATVDHLVRCFPEMRGSMLPNWCSTVQSLPDTRLLEPLEGELQRARADVDEAFLLLASLLGVEHPELSALRQRRERREARRKTQEAAVLKGGPEPETLELELECSACGAQNTYEVGALYMNPQDREEPPYIADELTCRSCGAADTLQLAGMGQYAVTGALLRMAMSGDPGRFQEGPVKLAVTRLADGRVTSIPKALADYHEKVGEHPDNVVYRLGLGNCYNTVGRLARAEADWRECLRIDPACPEAAYQLAEILDKRGRRLEAFHILHTTLQHRRHWRFHHLRNTTRQEFIEAYAGFYDELAPEGYNDHLKLMNMRFPDEAPAHTDMSGSLNNAMDKAETPRNAPCPCGSGKKYKKCCGKVK